VNRAHRYEPDPDPAYQGFAEHYEHYEHYRLTVLPARVRRPGDKAKDESGALVVECWILARLRHQTFLAGWA
jgi:hypothetical protein